MVSHLAMKKIQKSSYPIVSLLRAAVKARPARAITLQSERKNRGEERRLIRGDTHSADACDWL